MDDDAYSIIGALLARDEVYLIHHETMDNDWMVIWDVPRSESDLPRSVHFAKRRDWIASELPGAHLSTLTDFQERNQHPVPIDRDRLPSQVGWVSDTRFLRSCQALAAKSEITLTTGIAFSQVGFSADRNQALVRADSESCKYKLMGMGYYFLFTRDKGEWKKVDQTMAWIS
jgi:hypothetical protein